MAITSLISFLLPAYLVHHLQVQVYGAWVLILNLSAYVGYLDFGVQTAVSKYVAEYNAAGDHGGCGRTASSGLVITSIACGLGILLSGVLAWSVPQLFRNMPSGLYRDVRVSILFVGISLSINLAFAVFPAIFLGLQQYKVPTSINVISRVLYALVLCLAVSMHSSLATMGEGVAAVYLLTALLQFVAWRRWASHIRVRLYPVELPMLGQMFSYCFVLTVWSVCMLFISGVDLTIVGHYAFNQVGFYSIAASPNNFILIVIGALLGPLLPATSALSQERSPEQMGAILVRSTRCTTTLMLLASMPLLVGGFLILRLWVGSTYAVNSIQILRVLLIATALRQLMGPYATMVVATARQRFATATAITEGSVNLIASIWLAMHFGATGVAAGTLIGSLASVIMHFTVSMHYTRNLAISRVNFFLQGILRPAVIVAPSALLLPFWWFSGTPSMSLATWTLWGSCTLALAWCVALKQEDRDSVIGLVRRRVQSSQMA